MAWTIGRASDRRRPSLKSATRIVVLILAAAIPPRSAADGREDEAPPLGFNGETWAQERRLEAAFAARLEPGRISRTHRALTAQPHRAGTEGSRRVALLIKKEAEAAGFRPEIAEYLFYNSHPGPRSIELTAPIRKRLSLVEDRIPGDRFTERASDHPAFCAYSGSGSAEGEVVYVGQGTWEDFRSLEERGVSLAGRVALMRYFGAGEGAKVLRVQERGAVAAVLYADPKEDGFVHGPVYPRGNWRPPGSIMRRSLADTPYEGDPLTPGWAARPGAKRLDPSRIEGLPKIPVLPISYRDAEILLTHLGGPRAPDRMQGGLSDRLAYHLGPGPARLSLSVRMTPRTDTIRNVVVRIPGREETDSWIILGNHHDAWIYGGGDPSSGTAAQIEILRALGSLRRGGWRPRRTLIVAFWDAEEMNLGGSTEWVEDHAPDLLRRGVAAINMDSAVFNTERPLYVSASPCLHRLFREAAADVPGPDGKESLYASWLRMQNGSRHLASVDAFETDDDPSRPLSRPRIDPVPLGDDQTPFVEFLALPGSDMYYGADYGVYHSLYENRSWMTTIVDPLFRHHRLMAEFHGRLGLRLAMAPILPLDARETAASWSAAFEGLEARASALEVSSRLFRPVERALRRFGAAANAFDAARDEALRRDDGILPGAPERLQRINLELAKVEKSFFAPDGLPGHPWYRGLWAAPPRAVPGLVESRLPGLRWPLELGQEATLVRQVHVYGDALDEATAHLHRAQGLLATVGPAPRPD
jgi:N-acetylated-alpha-linked acidic dipeptidase